MTEIAALYRKHDQEARERADSANVAPIIAENPPTITMRAFRVEEALRDLNWREKVGVLSLVVHKAGHSLTIDGLPIGCTDGCQCMFESGEVG